jgi:hypothetical protein
MRGCGRQSGATHAVAVPSFAGTLNLGYLYDASLGGLVAAFVALQALAVPAVWLVTRGRRSPP